jgi:hypothetical protein
VLAVRTEKDGWLEVEFNDPQWGRRVGWVEKKLVVIEDPTLKPMDLSVQPVPAKPVEPVSGTARIAPATVSTEQPASATRKGFTILVNLGAGVQHDSFFEASAGGLAGLNLAVGGFDNPRTAVTFRVSGTNVRYGSGIFRVNQGSGVAGPAIQYWTSDRVNIEAGIGVGFWQTALADDTGLGLILSTNGVVFSQGRHSLQFGVEYAPVFVESGTIHNVGFTFGYQYHR